MGAKGNEAVAVTAYFARKDLKGSVSIHKVKEGVVRGQAMVAALPFLCSGLRLEL
jgi:hypothetical protein